MLMQRVIGLNRLLEHHQFPLSYLFITSNHHIAVIAMKWLIMCKGRMPIMHNCSIDNNIMVVVWLGSSEV